MSNKFSEKIRRLQSSMTDPPDLEMQKGAPFHVIEEEEHDNKALFQNTDIKSFGWRGVCANDKDGNKILSDVEGFVQCGQLLAIMGPSGSGKSTLLKYFTSQGEAPENLTCKGELFVNGGHHDQDIRRSSAYVQQDEATLRSLTIRETMKFAAQFSLPGQTKTNIDARIDVLLRAFSLKKIENRIIGTKIRDGISRGEEKLLGIAACLLTAPKILFLDEPTSGLDSAIAEDVVMFLRDMAKKYNLIIIASIHQPPTAVLATFDKLLLLTSRGNVGYFGPVSSVQAHFAFISLGTYFAEQLMRLMRTDSSGSTGQNEAIRKAWEGSRQQIDSAQELKQHQTAFCLNGRMRIRDERPSAIRVVPVLMFRSFIKSYRDIVPYGIRGAMYMVLAFVLGTIWLRLTPAQQNTQTFVNAIFFCGAFLPVTSIAYIPAFLEDRALYVKERGNGLYGPTAFLLTNFLIGIPYLFTTALSFSLVSYWLINFRPAGDAFFTWILWLFLDLMAAESVVVLVCSLVPNNEISLAILAFANAIWMCTGGFVVPVETMNPFWRYMFYYINYQSYVFKGMMVNEFAYRDFSCARGADGCMIEGKTVLQPYGYTTDSVGQWIGILLCFIAACRMLSWVVLHLKKT